MNVKFPFIYVNFDDPPEHDLLEITYNEWFHDVDCQYCIGPLRPAELAFALDSEGELFRVVFTGTDHSGTPEFRLEPSDDKRALVNIVKYVAERSQHIQSPKFKSIIRPNDH